MFDNNEAREKVLIVYLKSITRGIILSVLLLLISAFVFYYTDLDENLMGSVVWIIAILGICYSGIFCSYRIGSKGIIHGLMIGLIYIMLIGLISLLAEKGDFNLISYIIMLIMSVIIGGFSGIIGSMLGKS